MLHIEECTSFILSWFIHISLVPRIIRYLNSHSDGTGYLMDSLHLLQINCTESLYNVLMALRTNTEICPMRKLCESDQKVLNNIDHTLLKDVYIIITK